MLANAKMLERFQVQPAVVPQDLDGGAAKTGAYVSLVHFARVLVLVVFGDGSAGDDVEIKLYQAKDTSGTDAKVLNSIQTGRIYSKKGATEAALKAVGAFTKDTQAVADELYVDTDSGEAAGLYAVEVQQSDLDDGFNSIRADILSADGASAAKLAAALYIMGDPSYPAAPEAMVSPVL